MEKISDEILAVIAAALDSSMKEAGLKIIVKSIKRVSTNKSIWNTTGKLERLARRMNT